MCPRRRRGLSGIRHAIYELVPTGRRPDQVVGVGVLLHVTLAQTRIVRRSRTYVPLLPRLRNRCYSRVFVFAPVVPAIQILIGAMRALDYDELVIGLAECRLASCLR